MCEQESESRAPSGSRLGFGALVLVAVMLGGCGGSAVPLDRLVQEAVEAGPSRGSASYAPLDADGARSVALTVAALAAGAEPGEPPTGYRFADVTTAEAELMALTEAPEAGRAGGNGLYVVRPGAGNGLVVQVPHPVADRATEALGADLAVAAGADVLMVATAHRTAGEGEADVANVPGSVFGAVDAALVGPGSTVLQVHGFAAADHPERYGDVVLSSTVDEPSPLVERLADALSEAGFDVCVYDGERCAGLAGTQNLQGEHAGVVGAEFAHIEISDRVRQDEDRAQLLVDVLAGASRPDDR